MRKRQKDFAAAVCRLRQPLKIHFNGEWLQFLLALATQNRFSATFATVLSLLPRQEKISYCRHKSDFKGCLERFWRGADFFTESLYGYCPIRETEGKSVGDGQVGFLFQDGRQMSETHNYEKLAKTIAALDRNEVVKKIKNFNGPFRLDFTDEYLKGLSIDRLKHILFAALATKFKKTG